MFELGCAGAIVVRSCPVRLFSVVVLPQRGYVIYLCVHLPVVSLSSIMLLVGLVAEEVNTYAVQVRQDVAKPSDTDD